MKKTLATIILFITGLNFIGILFSFSESQWHFWNRIPALFYVGGAVYFLHEYIQSIK